MRVVNRCDRLTSPRRGPYRPRILTAPLDPRFRSFRIAVYAAFMLLTAIFIGCVIRSIWVDLYATAAPTTRSTDTTFSACVEDLESLTTRLGARAEAALSPKGLGDWGAFTGDFDRSLALFQRRCLDASPVGGSPERLRTLSEAVEKVDALRLHLSRCGEEGEQDRQALARALEGLRATARP
jgi:hypothetical protein